MLICFLRYDVFNILCWFKMIWIQNIYDRGSFSHINTRGYVSRDLQMLKPYNHRIVLLKIKIDQVLNNSYFIPNNPHILPITFLPISSRNQSNWKKNVFLPFNTLSNQSVSIFSSYASIFLRKLADSYSFIESHSLQNYPLSPSIFIFLFEIIPFSLQTHSNTSHPKILYLSSMYLILWQNSSKKNHIHLFSPLPDLTFSFPFISW